MARESEFERRDHLLSRKHDVMGGALCIDGTRIPVAAVKGFWREGRTVEQIGEQYAELTAEQIEAAIAIPMSMKERMQDTKLDPEILELADRLHWYALLVPPQKEFVAQKILRKKGLRTFVPVKRDWRKANRYTKAKDLNAFPALPRYVFAGFDPGAVLWFDLFNLSVVTGVVSLNGEPYRIPSAPMVRLIKRTGGGLNAPDVAKYMRSHHEFNVGDLVEIVDGPFAGQFGNSIPVTKIKGMRAKLLVEILGGALEIDVPLEVLEAA